jgi:hypothetical protein
MTEETLASIPEVAQSSFSLLDEDELEAHQDFCQALSQFGVDSQFIARYSSQVTTESNDFEVRLEKEELDMLNQKADLFSKIVELEEQLLQQMQQSKPQEKSKKHGGKSILQPIKPKNESDWRSLLEQFRATNPELIAQLEQLYLQYEEHQ